MYFLSSGEWEMLTNRETENVKIRNVNRKLSCVNSNNYEGDIFQRMTFPCFIFINMTDTCLLYIQKAYLWKYTFLNFSELKTKLCLVLVALLACNELTTPLPKSWQAFLWSECAFLLRITASLHKCQQQQQQSLFSSRFMHSVTGRCTA